MTKRQAINILIQHAAENAAGCGRGIRSIPSAERIEELKWAILKVWPNEYPVEWFNIGLSPPVAPKED